MEPWIVVAGIVVVVLPFVLLFAFNRHDRADSAGRRIDHRWRVDPRWRVSRLKT